MAPPPSYAVSPVVALIVRILTLVCLAISLILLTTATGTASTSYVDVDVRFKDFMAFRYLCAAVVIGLAYTLVQTGFTVFQLTTGNRFGGGGLVYFDFFGDKVRDMKGLSTALGLNRFIRVTNAATSLCLLGFVFSAVSSVFSSFALPKRV